MYIYINIYIYIFIYIYIHDIYWTLYPQVVWLDPKKRKSTKKEMYEVSRFHQCCSVLQCTTVCCLVLQCVAVCCSVLQCVEEKKVYQAGDVTLSSVLQCVAVCCSVLQCVAVCCSVLQCVAVCCSVLQCVAVCHSALHSVAVCYSVLQGVEEKDVYGVATISRLFQIVGLFCERDCRSLLWKSPIKETVFCKRDL